MPSYKKNTDLKIRIALQKLGIALRLALLFAHPAIRNVHGRKTRPGVLYFSYLNIPSRSSWQIGLRPFAVSTLIAASLSATRKIMQALFALLARKA